MMELEPRYPTPRPINCGSRGSCSESMLGVHRRMGDMLMPDRALSQFELKSCFEVLESKWKTFERDPVGRKKVSLTACILITGYHAALRGEEVNRADVETMRKYWTEAVSHVHHPHIRQVRSKRR
jgi:hypothetical protein